MKRSVFTPTYPFQLIGRRALGRTGASVSEICLGTMNFGWRLDRDASFDLLDRFRRAGGNFVQAVSVDPDAQGGFKGMAHPEVFVGDWMAERGVRRRDWFLSTRLTLCRAAGVSVGARIRRALERSLQRFGVDDLDLLVCEWTPAFLPMDEMLTALDGLVVEGKLRYFALSGFPTWRVSEAVNRSGALGLRRATAMQCDYSLLQRREVELETSEPCLADQMGVIVTSSLAGGVLANLARPPGGRSTRRMNRLNDHKDEARTREIMALLASVARAHGVPESRVALAWCLARPWVSSVLVSGYVPDYLSDAMASSRLRLRAEDVAALDAVSLAPLVSAEGESWARDASILDSAGELSMT